MTSLQLVKRHWVNVLLASLDASYIGFLADDLCNLHPSTLRFLCEKWTDKCSDTTLLLSASQAEQTSK